MKKTYGYARVSTREQHLDRQLKTLMDAGVEERDIITDKVSGKDLEREGYQSLKNHFLRDGDTLIVKSLDRLSRRKIDIKKELEYFREHHITVVASYQHPGCVRDQQTDPAHLTAHGNG